MKGCKRAKTGAAFDSELADDLHEVVHFSVKGRFAAFQMLLHGDAGIEGQDHFRQCRGFHPGLLGFDISCDQVFNNSAAL